VTDDLIYLKVDKPRNKISQINKLNIGYECNNYFSSD
jgi:hypothetical protein